MITFDGVIDYPDKEQIGFVAKLFSPKKLKISLKNKKELAQKKSLPTSASNIKKLAPKKTIELITKNKKYPEKSQLLINGKVRKVAFKKSGKQIEFKNFVKLDPSEFHNFNAIDYPSNLIMNIHFDEKIKFFDSSVVISKTKKGLEFSYLCGFSNEPENDAQGDSFFSFPLNPFRIVVVAAKSSKKSMISSSPTFPNDYKDAALAEFIYTSKASGNVYEHYMEGIKLIQMIFNISIKSIVNKIKKQK